MEVKQGNSEGGRALSGQLGHLGSCPGGHGQTSKSLGLSVHLENEQSGFATVSCFLGLK